MNIDLRVLKQALKTVHNCIGNDLTVTRLFQIVEEYEAIQKAEQEQHVADALAEGYEPLDHHNGGKESK